LHFRPEMNSSKNYVSKMSLSEIASQTFRLFYLHNNNVMLK
jgi:hypothetical protein